MKLHVRGILALLIVTVVWGTSFPAMKDLSHTFSPIWIAFLRFALSGALLAPFMLRARRADWVAGILLGVTLFAAFLFQVEALWRMNANRNAFISGLSILIVPLLGLSAGRMPEKRIVIAVLLSLVGLFAMCWDGGGWGEGDTLALLCAFCFAVYVKLMETLTRRASSMMAVTAIQIAVVALCAGAWIALLSPAFDWAQIRAGVEDHLVNLLYLGVLATAVVIALQTWGQRHTSANEAAVVYALEPACAAIASWFWLQETMSARSVAGGALLIAGMIVSQWRSSKKSSQETHSEDRQEAAQVLR
jgi:drug/metabolite transporter (DMT)-like permease